MFLIVTSAKCDPTPSPWLVASGHCCKQGKNTYLKNRKFKEKPLKQAPENSHREQSGQPFRQEGMLALKTASFGCATCLPGGTAGQIAHGVSFQKGLFEGNMSLLIFHWPTRSLLEHFL